MTQTHLSTRRDASNKWFYLFNYKLNRAHDTIKWNQGVHRSHTRSHSLVSNFIKGSLILFIIVLASMSEPDLEKSPHRLMASLTFCKRWPWEDPTRCRRPSNIPALKIWEPFGKENQIEKLPVSVFRPWSQTQAKLFKCLVMLSATFNSTLLSLNSLK